MSVQWESPGAWASSRKKCLRNSYPSGCVVCQSHWDEIIDKLQGDIIRGQKSTGIRAMEYPGYWQIQLGGIRMKFSHRPQAGKETHDVGVSLVEGAVFCYCAWCISAYLKRCHTAMMQPFQRKVSEISKKCQMLIRSQTKYLAIVGHILAPADMVNIPVLSSLI